jgi:hypothetical protein
MLDDFRDMLNETEGRIFSVIALFAIAIMTFAVAGALEGEKQWQQFAADHDCVKVEQIKGNVLTGVGYGMTANGTMGTVVTTTVEPDRIGWRCNDGVTYWR